MRTCEFMKNLPSNNVENFSSQSKESLRSATKPLVIYSVSVSPSEKRIVTEKQPLLLRYLNKTWTEDSTTTARQGRKRASGAASGEGDASNSACLKTRKEE